MSITIQQKQHYNKLAQRLQKAIKFFDDVNIAYDKKEPYESDLRKLCEEMNKIVKEWKSKGIKVEDEQVLRGFEEE